MATINSLKLSDRRVIDPTAEVFEPFELPTQTRRLYAVRRCGGNSVLGNSIVAKRHLYKNGIHMSLKIEGKLPGYNNSYHFHASPKYRQSALVGNVADRLEQLLNEKSVELSWKIHAIAVDSDHVHFLIESEATPSEIAQRLFGYASFMLRKEFPELKKINVEHFWGGRQCKAIADQEHFNNTLAYIVRHAQAPR